MHKGILMAVLDQGAKLVLTDGTVWVINPADTVKSVNWKPPVMVEVSEKSDHKEFDYTLSNAENSEKVTARRRK